MWGSMFSKVKLWLTPKRTLKEQAERAYGLWLAGPQKNSPLDFISNMTGIPRHEVWGLIYGKKEENATEL